MEPHTIQTAQSAYKQPEVIGPLLTAATIIRNCVGGGVFIAAYCYTQHSSSPATLIQNMSQNTWVTLGIALVAGISLYSFHRALPNILIEHFREWIVRHVTSSKSFFWTQVGKFVAPERILRLARRRWLYLADVKRFHTHVTDWGDYIHLQYCSVWAICAASTITAMTSDCWVFNPPLFMVALLIFLSGFVSDLRKQVVEEWLYRIDDKIQEDLAKTPPVLHNAWTDIQSAESTPIFKQVGAN